MEVMKTGNEEFVTVVSVGNSPADLDNFVTVLSIGNGLGEKVDDADKKGSEIADQDRDEIVNPGDGHPEEEVDVFRLPGERLGFGLKFEGGNKTSEKVRKLFVQSCAAESPASRASCSWGTLGEGDEVLSIDGVPVTEMTRLDCVRRLKESQLVIKLLVRYRGALRPEVVSAERKSSPEKRTKVPPELPSAPPPVPPRKLRQPRGPADGEANPSPVRKPWDSPKSANSSSNESPSRIIQTQNSFGSRESSSKSTSFESCVSSPTSSKNNSKNSSPKNSNGNTQQSPDLNKSRNIQEPAEASVYLDARCHDGCSSTQGSTSDDTGSSMSTVIDCRFSSSDRFSTRSTISTTSTTSDNHQVSQPTDSPMEISAAENIDLVRLLAPFDQLEREFGSNPPTTDYLLSRLANSEAVTFVESLGDGDGVVERVTAVVAPNTVLIEETLTLQPPLSFQDAPLSYGHETRPGLVYTDLAADSTTHFRPIKDDALIVDCVNGNVDQVVIGPPLPARNHVQRINVNQDDKETVDPPAPALPPKPMPRKELKNKRKRPPPPPPPPRREIAALAKSDEDLVEEGGKIVEDKVEVVEAEEENVTNKMMEIIEMKKAKALSEKTVDKDKDNKDEATVSETVKKSNCDNSAVIVKKKVDCGEEKMSVDENENENENENNTKELVEDQATRIEEMDRGKESQDDEDSTDESDGDSYYWQSNLATIGEEEETNSLEFTSANRNSESDREENVKKPEKLNSESSTTDGDEVDCLRREENTILRKVRDDNSPRDSLEEKKSSEKNTVNGRMDNCGGGQRLPPDGDEFPATYQEFSNVQQQQQYQFVAGARVSSTGDPCTVVTGDTDPFSTKFANDSLEKNKNTTNNNNNTDTSTSNDLKNSNCQEKTILLQDSRVISLRSSVCCTSAEITLKNDLQLPMTGVQMQNDNYYSYNGRNDDGNIVVSEKKITISGYYDQDSPANPPPLPTSRPPKVEIGKGLSQPVQPVQRKFSLNGDSWRQDDKSEKSVRDKIAMFSSQSSLEAPLFPVVVSPSASTTSGRRLSRYKSSEDVFNEEPKSQGKEKSAQPPQRTRSSLDLTMSTYDAPPPSLPLTSPPGSPIPKISSNFIYKSKMEQDAVKDTTSRRSNSLLEFKTPKIMTKNTNTVSYVPPTPPTPGLTRATSFSGGSSSLHSRSQSLSDLPPNLAQISRTNSLASNFRRPNDEMRRASLNQLIEQRRKGISKLRGLVIPEKETIPATQPIVDLPEIKSRDSILLQLPRSNLHDKWGSQSSISSSISAVSVPGKVTTSFKMPEPQNLPKYSPAFKRKSLAVYGKESKASEAPKSLESICSPTRSDFSFEYVPTTGSPRSRTTLRKARTEYDDSDNDSAVSSSQSSISRGFSPPGSPVSSERSYISAETTLGNFHLGESRAVTLERSQFTTRPSYNHSERSSSSSSSPDPRSPQQSDIYSRNGCAQQLHHHALKRSSSTDTNCSTSSTLTSGSQASAESLSRRVLKPQSVEAINRKNILASARCRSGRDLNGSPLIQRKFSDPEETPVSKLAQDNGSYKPTDEQLDVKIAYIEVNEDEEQKPVEEDVQPTKWVRKKSETESEGPGEPKKVEIEVQVRSQRVSSTEKPSSSQDLIQSVPRSRSSFVETEKLQAALENSKPRSRSSLVLERSSDTQSDLVNVLSTKSRSRSSIHIEERTFSRSRSQMSLEEILDGKSEDNQPSSIQSNSSSRSWIKEKSFASKIPTPERPKLTQNDKSEESSQYSIQKVNSSKIPTPRSLQGRRSASATDVKKAVEKSEQISSLHAGSNTSHSRFSSLDSSGVDEPGHTDSERYSTSEQFGSISSLASTTSLISQQELAQLVEEATLEEPKGAHDVIVVLYHKENPAGNVGITLAGGVDCETKEITVHRVLAHSIADKDGRVQRGDRILSINGRSTKGLTHRESLTVLKQPRSEIVLVVSRARDDGGARLRSRTESVETIVEGSEMNGSIEDQTAWGPPATVSILKDGAGLGFSLEGGRDSPLGDRPLIVKKIFAGGAAEKTGALRAGDQMIEVNGSDVTRMSRIEAWSLMKKLNDGDVSLLVRHPATKSSS